MSGEAVPQSVRMHTFLNARTLGGFLTRAPNGFRIDGPILAIVAGKQPGAGLDRKSTRLNSSHLGISYAVFCLKKKNAADGPPRGREGRRSDPRLRPPLT